GVALDILALAPAMAPAAAAAGAARRGAVVQAIESGDLLHQSLEIYRRHDRELKGFLGWS
ncbi:unnamed protein product, partial [Prorocentrum cordatum]